jgi:hypothetical protein
MQRGAWAVDAWLLAPRQTAAILLAREEIKGIDLV